MLDFKDEIVEFNLKGKKYSLSKPNNGQIREYKNSFDKCETNDEKEKCLQDFLVDLGLEPVCFDLLSPKQTEMLLKELYSSEKN